MNQFRSLFAVCALLCSVSLFANDVVEDQTISLKERVGIASRIYADIRMYFAHWQGVPSLDLDKEYGAYLEQVLASNSRRAFDLAGMEFVAKLQNGHSGFRDRWLQETSGQQLNFYACPIAGKWVVTRSSLPELKPGDVLAAINGEPFEAFYQRSRKYISGSDERWRRRAFLEYPYLFPQEFQLSLADGRHVAVRRSGKFQFTGSEYKKIEVTDRHGVLLIRIPAFYPADFENDAVEALKQAASAKAIIIDVRSNHGGSTPERLTRALMDRPYRWYAESTPAHLATIMIGSDPGTHAELRWFGGVQQPSDTLYKGPVFLLIDGGCYSACEDFVVPFKDNHRATIIGERTGGSSGQPYSYRFENGMSIGLSAKREFMPDGSPFEGVGIAPDIEVPLSAADLLSGTDPALAKALELAKAH